MWKRLSGKSCSSGVSLYLPTLRGVSDEQRTRLLWRIEIESRALANSSPTTPRPALAKHRVSSRATSAAALHLTYTWTLKTG
jgi:hypothetical protein